MITGTPRRTDPPVDVHPAPVVQVSSPALARLASSARVEFSVPRLVPAPHGVVVQAHGRAWWLAEHVDGRQPHPGDATDTAAVAVGLARLHTAPRDLPGTLAVSAENLVSLFETGARLAADPRVDFSPDDRKIVDVATAVVFDRLEALQRAGTQLIHGDPSNPNLCVKDNPVRLTGALDWLPSGGDRPSNGDRSGRQDSHCA
jgi:Ser/Thr protein kinase RdoA (MazF antagonist)